MKSSLLYLKHISFSDFFSLRLHFILICSSTENIQEINILLKSNDPNLNKLNPIHQTGCKNEMRCLVFYHLLMQGSCHSIYREGRKTDSQLLSSTTKKSGMELRVAWSNRESLY